MEDFWPRHYMYPGIKAFWCPDTGSLICRGRKWWGTNDQRWDLVGVLPNSELAQPTVGPFSSKEEALKAFNEGRRVCFYSKKKVSKNVKAEK